MYDGSKCIVLCGRKNNGSDRCADMQPRNQGSRAKLAKGTDAQAAETRRYIQELEADIMPIDTLISFAQSEEGKTYFGEDTATGIAAHAKEIKAAGAKYCDCPACAIVAEILEKKADMLK